MTGEMLNDADLEYARSVTQRRTPALQTFLDGFVERAGIEQDFMDSSEHSYTCTCQKCLGWWASMGPEEGSFGPFTQEQIESYCNKNGLEIWW